MLELLGASRPLQRGDHYRIREHIPTINRLGDLGVKWHPLGQARATLIERGQFQRALEKQAGRLSLLGIHDLQSRLSSHVAEHLPASLEKFTAPIRDVDFMGNGLYMSIAYILEADWLETERSIITEEIDRLNGVNCGWDEFEPFVSVATIPKGNMSDDILDSFWDIHPENLTLERLEIRAS